MQAPFLYHQHHYISIIFVSATSPYKHHPDISNIIVSATFPAFGKKISFLIFWMEWHRSSLHHHWVEWNRPSLNYRSFEFWHMHWLVNFFPRIVLVRAGHTDMQPNETKNIGDERDTYTGMLASICTSELLPFLSNLARNSHGTRSLMEPRTGDWRAMYWHKSHGTRSLMETKTGDGKAMYWHACACTRMRVCRCMYSRLKGSSHFSKVWVFNCESTLPTMDVFSCLSTAWDV